MVTPAGIQPKLCRRMGTDRQGLHLRNSQNVIYRLKPKAFGGTHTITLLRKRSKPTHTLIERRLVICL